MNWYKIASMRSLDQLPEDILQSLKLTAGGDWQLTHIGGWPYPSPMPIGRFDKVINVHLIGQDVKALHDRFHVNVVIYVEMGSTSVYDSKHGQSSVWMSATIQGAKPNTSPVPPATDQDYEDWGKGVGLKGPIPEAWQGDNLDDEARRRLDYEDSSHERGLAKAPDGFMDNMETISQPGGKRTAPRPRTPFELAKEVSEAINGMYA